MSAGNLKDNFNIFASSEALFTFFLVVWTHSFWAPFTTIHSCTVCDCTFHRLENCPRYVIHHTKAVVWVWFCHKICFAFNLCPSWISMCNPLCPAYWLNRLKRTEKAVKPKLFYLTCFLFFAAVNMNFKTKNFCFKSDQKIFNYLISCHIVKWLEKVWTRHGHK